MINEAMLPKQHSRECLRLSSGFALYSRGEPDGDHVPVLCQTDVQWALGNNKTKKDWAGQRSLNMALKVGFRGLVPSLLTSLFHLFLTIYYRLSHQTP